MNPGSVTRPVSEPGARYRRAVARAPSRRHPAPPSPSRPTPREGRQPLDLEDAHVEPSTASHPSRGEAAIEPLAELDLVARHRVDGSLADFRQPSRWTCPFAGSRSVVGPPVARGAASHGLSSLVEIDSLVHTNRRRWFIRLSEPDPCEPGDPTGASPRGRRPVTGTPLLTPPLAANSFRWAHRECPPDFRPTGRRSFALQSPTSFRPPGCRSSRFVSVTELGTAPRSTRGNF
jgi:hypothetical protein